MKHSSERVTAFHTATVTVCTFKLDTPAGKGVHKIRAHGDDLPGYCLIHHTGSGFLGVSEVLLKTVFPGGYSSQSALSKEGTSCWKPDLAENSNFILFRELKSTGQSCHPSANDQDISSSCHCSPLTNSRILPSSSSSAERSVTDNLMGRTLKFMVFTRPAPILAASFSVVIR